MKICLRLGFIHAVRILAFCSLLSGSHLFWALEARELPVAPPQEAGMSSEKLGEIKGAVQSLLDKKLLAGAITMVARQGKVVHFETHGLMDVESGQPMPKDAIFRIYSMTKPIATVAAMMLHEDGKYQLDDPVSRFIPELKGVKVHQDGTEVSAKNEMTIRDLMRHTAGLTYGFFGNTPVDQRYRDAGVLAPQDDSQAMAKKLGSLPLLYHPGEKWVYSVSVDVLGILVERVSGQLLDQFLRERIFEPLDMKDTGFHVPEEKIKRLVTNYSPDGQGGLRVNDAPEESRYRSVPAFFSGGGGLVSTARDYMRFLQMLLHGGELYGARILRPESVKMMIRNQLPEGAYPISIGTPRPGTGFGLGFSVRMENSAWDPDGRIGEYGWGGAASTHFWVSPADQLAVVTLEQTMPYTWHVEWGIKGLIYDAITHPTANPPRNKAAGASNP